MRRLSAVGLAALVMPLALAACGDDSGSSDDEIVVGAILPLSGPAAQLGQAFRAGIELAVEHINNNGGITIDGDSKTLKVDMIDDESTPAGDQRAVQDLLTKDVRIFLGPSISSSFDTAYAVLKEDPNRLVLSSAAAAEDDLTADSDRLFKTIATQVGPALPQFAEVLTGMVHPKRVAILQTQDPTGDLVLPGLEQGFKDLGVEVVYKNQAAPTTTDFIPFISAIQKADPDLVITPYLDTMGGPFIDQALEVGLNTNFASYAGSLAQVADHEDEVEFFAASVSTRAVDNADDTAVAPFRQAYEAKYGESPAAVNFWALGYYDPVLMLASAIEEAGTATDAGAIGKALEGVTSWDGQVLPMTFDETGLAHYPRQFVVVEKGKVSFEVFDDAGS